MHQAVTVCSRVDLNTGSITYTRNERQIYFKSILYKSEKFPLSNVKKQNKVKTAKNKDVKNQLIHKRAIASATNRVNVASAAFCSFVPNMR